MPKVSSCVVGRWQGRRLDVFDLKTPLVLNVTAQLIEDYGTISCWQLKSLNGNFHIYNLTFPMAWRKATGRKLVGY